MAPESDDLLGCAEGKPVSAHCGEPMAVGIPKPPDGATALAALAGKSEAHARCSEMKSKMLRAMLEIGFIIFLFYSNLLMGEFERSGHAAGRGPAWAFRDIFTAANFVIGLIAALVGYCIVEALRNRI